MDKLIEALQIFRKYGNPDYPTICEHDELYVLIQPDDVSQEDLDRLRELSFKANYSENNFSSFKYGSA